MEEQIGRTNKRDEIREDKEDLTMIVKFVEMSNRYLMIHK